jgi:excinuclease ABC subunit A
MGPEGGSGGGTVVAEGTPEDVATITESHTGRFLKEILAGRSRVSAPPGEPAPPKLPAKKRAPAKKPAKKKVAAAR